MELLSCILITLCGMCGPVSQPFPFSFSYFHLSKKKNKNINFNIFLSFLILYITLIIFYFYLNKKILLQYKIFLIFHFLQQLK
jgi:hypothetical protein